MDLRKLALQTIKPLVIQYLRERGLVLPKSKKQELAKKLRLSEQRIDAIAEAVKEALLELLEKM